MLSCKTLPCRHGLASDPGRHLLRAERQAKDVLVVAVLVLQRDGDCAQWGAGAACVKSSGQGGSSLSVRWPLARDWGGVPRLVATGALCCFEGGRAWPDRTTPHSQKGGSGVAPLPAFPRMPPLLSCCEFAGLVCLRILPHVCVWGGGHCTVTSLNICHDPSPGLKAAP